MRDARKNEKEKKGENERKCEKGWLLGGFKPTFAWLNGYPIECGFATLANPLTNMTCTLATCLMNTS